MKRRNADIFLWLAILEGEARRYYQLLCMYAFTLTTSLLHRKMLRNREILTSAADAEPSTAAQSTQKLLVPSRSSTPSQPSVLIAHLALRFQ